MRDANPLGWHNSFSCVYASFHTQSIFYPSIFAILSPSFKLCFSLFLFLRIISDERVLRSQTNVASLKLCTSGEWQTCRMCVPSTDDVICSHDLYVGVDRRGVGGCVFLRGGTGPLISVNGAVKRRRFGLRPLYLCCLFCFRRLNMEQRRCKVGGVNGGVLKCFHPSLFYFSIHSHCINNYKILFSIFLWLSSPHIWLWNMTTILLLYNKAVSRLAWGRNRHSVYGLHKK